MTINLHELQPQYIIDKSGKKISVVLPIEIFDALLEDVHDLSVINSHLSESRKTGSGFRFEVK